MTTAPLLPRSKREPRPAPQQQTPDARAESIPVPSKTGGISFVAAMALSNAGNFIFHMIASRRLGPASYGALASTLGVMLALALPTASIQVSVTRSAAQLFSRGGDYSVRHFIKRGLMASLALSLVLAVFAAALASGLKLDSTGAVLWLAAFAPAAFVSTVGRGILLGEGRFLTLSLIVLGTTSSRVLSAWLLLNPGDTETKAMMLTVSVEYALAGLLAMAMAPRLRRSARRVRVSTLDLSTSSVAFAGLWVLLAADLVFARRLLSPEQAGLYAAAALGGRAALFVPQAIAQIAHARLAGASQTAGVAIVRTAIGATLVFSAANLIGMAVLGPWLIVVGFGSEYAPDRGLVVVLTAAAAALAIGNLAIHLRLALGRRSSRSWIGLVALGLLTLVIPATAFALGGASVIAALLLVASLSHPVTMRSDSAEPDGQQADHVALRDVSIVVPYRAACARSVRSFESIAKIAEAEGWNFELIAISRDGTSKQESTIRRLAGNAVDHLSCLVLSGNAADAQAAFRLGAAAASGRNVVLFDPESDVDPATIASFVELREFYQCDAVVGSKRHPDSEADYPPTRRVASWGFQQLVRALFRITVRDCQVSVKVFSHDTIRDVLPATATKGLAFELELLVLASRCGHRRLVEAPVSIGTAFPRTVGANAAMSMIRATMQLRLRLARQSNAERPTMQATSQVRI